MSRSYTSAAAQSLQLQSSPAQRCHPDPLSIALSFLDRADFGNAARTCRQWAAASRRKSAWPAPQSIAQLADFSVQTSRLLHCGTFLRGDSKFCRMLDDVLRTPVLGSVAALDISLYELGNEEFSTLLQQASQLQAHIFLSLSVHQPTWIAMSDNHIALLSQCSSLQALRMRDVQFSAGKLPNYKLPKL